MVFVGKKSFKSKDGKAVYYQVFCLRPFNDFDTTYSVEVMGDMVETVWVPKEVFDKLTEKYLDCEIDFVSTFINGRMSITDVTINE